MHGSEALTRSNFEHMHVSDDIRLSVADRYVEAVPTTIQASLGVLALTSLAINFSKIERVPRYSPERRENDAEHSFMLAIVAPELATAFYPHLDAAKVHQYSTVHDLIELITDDMATFKVDSQTLAKKKADEHNALPRLLSLLPPYTANLLAAYEAQEDSESRFVKCVDKILPLATDIVGEGSQVMHEDYNVYTLLELDECQEALQARIAATFGDEFPEIVDIRSFLGKIFSDLFIAKQ